MSSHVRAIFPEPLNLFFLTKLGMLMYYHEAMCHSEKLVHYLQCQGHSENLYDQNTTVFSISSELALIVQHHKPEYPVEELNYCIQGQGHSKGSEVNVCPDDIFRTTEHFVTRPGMVMQHHKPECCAEKLVHCVQCKGHNEVFYQNMTIFVVFSKLLVGLQPNLV